MIRVAALYVERGGPYFSMPDVDPWDKARDARTYAGPHPVVAHPPCGPWGELRHLYKGDEHDCAVAALEAVRRWGGVMEHPLRSKFWRHARIVEPQTVVDEWQGFTIDVEQVSWGHVARKPTRLYFVRVGQIADSAIPRGGEPTHWCSGNRANKGGGSVPPGIKVCSATQRRRTPPRVRAMARRPSSDGEANVNGSHRVGDRDKRGSAMDRKRRRRWIRKEFGVDGDGRTVLCHHCSRPIRKFHIDRFPVCGHLGGTYRRGNIVPSCAECNATRCGSGAACRTTS